MTLIPADLLALLARPFSRVVVFSGAGMSADSGIPTFRSGSNGLWSQFDPMELATPEAWRRDRDMVWGWYEWRRGLVMAAAPHAGHLAVAAMQRTHNTAVVTQNVDDLHERAGASDVLHLHGSLFAARCSRCGQPHELGVPPAQAQARLQPPDCERCGSPIRPGVVWFGESLDGDVIDASLTHIASCDLLLIVGTSGVVHPAAGLVAHAPRDAVVIEINPQPGETNGRLDYRWQVTASQGLPLIARHLSPDVRC